VYHHRSEIHATDEATLAMAFNLLKISLHEGEKKNTPHRETIESINPPPQAAG
jgi:hypothetical protein